jgi:hypothetical protein
MTSEGPLTAAATLPVAAASRSDRCAERHAEAESNGDNLLQRMRAHLTVPSEEHIAAG